jgi:hypothetical protein
MTKVYVVEYGFYSDRVVSAVCATLEAAQAQHLEGKWEEYQPSFSAIEERSWECKVASHSEAFGCPYSIQERELVK